MSAFNVVDIERSCDLREGKYEAHKSGSECAALSAGAEQETSSDAKWYQAFSFTSYVFSFFNAFRVHSLSLIPIPILKILKGD